MGRRGYVAVLAMAGLISALAHWSCSKESSESGGGSGGAGAATTTSNSGSTTTNSTSSSSSATGQSCLDCTEHQTCQSCVDAVHTYANCKNNAAVSADEFACQWLACKRDTEVCGQTIPQGDGCKGAECLALPAQCVDAPPCDCLLAHFYTAHTCSADAEGNLTITCQGFCYSGG